jgi:hypothetical protein
MERSINSFRFESESNALPETHESSKCDTCGEEFETPLFAVISSGYLKEEYLACPRCLAKVRTVDRQKHVEPEEAEEEEAEEPEVMEVKEKVVCAHHLGYLKRRPKNSPIPEECLTCTKMIDCMSY